MNTEFSRDDFVARRLSQDEPEPSYARFQHLPLSEKEDARAGIVLPLAETVFLHHSDPGNWKDELKELGCEEVAQSIDRRPRDQNTRLDNLGEIIASEYFRQVEGYQIPTHCLRYNQNPESSIRGDDDLGFKFGDEHGNGRGTVVVETKVPFIFERKAVDEAYASPPAEACRNRWSAASLHIWGTSSA